MFKADDRVKFLRAVDPSHVDKVGTVVEVSFHEPPLYGVRLDLPPIDPERLQLLLAKEPRNALSLAERDELEAARTPVTVGCVQEKHIELVTE